MIRGRANSSDITVILVARVADADCTDNFFASFVEPAVERNAIRNAESCIAPFAFHNILKTF